jgi:hypothetical protein
MKNYGYVLMILLALVLQPFFVSAAGASATSYDPNTASLLTVSLVNQDPDPAIAGSIVEVRLGVQNNGGQAANNVLVELLPEYPFTIASGDTAIRNVGTIEGYQSNDNLQIIKYKLLVDKNANAGDYSFQVRYGDEGVATTQKTIPISLKSQDGVEIIHIDKTVLIPGKQNSLKFTINNVGNSPLRDMKFSWLNSAGILLPVGSDNTKYIKYLDVGSSVDVEYQVIADSNADAGLYKLDLTLIYPNSLTGVDEEIQTIAGVYVGGGTDFDIAYSESSSSTTSFTIANTGSNPAFSVSVVVPQQNGWSVSGANSMIIGNLNTGDYTVASFSLKSSQTGAMVNGQRTQLRNVSQQGATPPTGTLASQNTLKVQIVYTDTMGNRETIEKNVTMSQSSISGSNSTGYVQGIPGNFRGVQQQSFFSKYATYIYYFFGFVIVVCIGIVYRKYRKEKLLNPNYRLKDVFRKKEIPAGKRK